MSAGYRLRADPADFRVEEVPLFAPSGEGGHTYVRIEKCGRTTEEVARLLASLAGARPRDVGYAGRKDRRAVAVQWLSVPGLAPETALAWEAPGVRVLEAVPHVHKLRTGALRANRFRLVVRETAPGAASLAAERMAELVRSGMPNRFGAQRFGAHGDNAERGRALLASGAAPRDRRTARFLLSALQARAFNDVLERRPWPPGELRAGDVAVVHASGGLFRVDDPAREQPRADAFELSPTGPIPGTRMRRATGEPGALEEAILAGYGFGPELRPPRGIRLRGARRPLRVRPGDAACRDLGGGALELRFVLPAGSFATVLVETLLGPSRDAGSTPGPQIAYPPQAASGEDPRP